MTEKELRKLNRSQLLEILEIMRTEIDRLNDENQLLKDKMKKESDKVDEILDLVRQNNALLGGKPDDAEAHEQECDDEPEQVQEDKQDAQPENENREESKDELEDKDEQSESSEI